MWPCGVDQFSTTAACCRSPSAAARAATICTRPSVDILAFCAVSHLSRSLSIEPFAVIPFLFCPTPHVLSLYKPIESGTRMIRCHMAVFFKKAFGELTCRRDICYSRLNVFRWSLLHSVKLASYREGHAVMRSSFSTQTCALFGGVRTKVCCRCTRQMCSSRAHQSSGWLFARLASNDHQKSVDLHGCLFFWASVP